MIIKNFIGRLSGVVTYSDQTTGQFAVTVDEKGNFATIWENGAIIMRDNSPPL